MKSFYLVTNIVKDPDYTITLKVRDYIVSRNRVCYVSPPESFVRDGRFFVPKEQIPEDVDCIISLGGDGTLLRTARFVLGTNIPIVGINLGNLGFLAQISPTSIFESLDKLMDTEPDIEERMMLHGEVVRDGEVIAKDHALNDIVISRNGHKEMLRLNIYVDGSFLNSYRADGIIAATPTGSTGYSLAAGGPIVAPDSRILMLTPLAPQSLINRSVIYSAGSRIEVELGPNKDGEPVIAVASWDGDTKVEVKTGDRIVIFASVENSRLVKVSEGSFWDTLRQKMSTML